MDAVWYFIIIIIVAGVYMVDALIKDIKWLRGRIQELEDRISDLEYKKSHHHQE